MSEDKPNLYREIFPYDDVPYIDFEEGTPKLNIPDDI